MKPRSYSVIMLVFLFLSIFHSTNVFSQTAPVAAYGPKQYDKPKGSPVTYTNTFEASPSASYSLWVQSGENGLQEAKNVTISVNDIEIIRSGDIRTANPVSKPVSLQRFNKITVTLKGKGGNYINVKVLCDTCSPLQVRIDSPADGESVTTPFVTVKGTFESFADAGVTVNGVIAQRHGDKFVANNVPVSAGTNTLTAAATDTYGGKAMSNIYVEGQPVEEFIRLAANIETGIDPLDVTLTVEAQINNPIADSSLTYIGPTAATTKISPTEYRVSMSSPGLYLFTLKITDALGNVFEDSIGIAALSKVEIDILLKDKWDGMKWAITHKDVQNAVGHFADEMQERYSGIFTTLGDGLPQLAQGMQKIDMVYLKRGAAKYRIRRMESAGEITYYIYFTQDKNGLWKIDKF